MRLRQFVLGTYGKFKNRTIKFPSAERDFHVIVGENEAGKTTLLNAIVDGLFGFPPRIEKTDSRLQKGSTDDLELGVSLNSGDAGLDFRRRAKGKKNQYFDKYGKEVPYIGNRLATLLGAVNTKKKYVAQFGLDHAQLREGAEYLANEDSELGARLFEASLKASGFNDIRKNLGKTADEIWKKRQRTNRLKKLLDELKKKTLEIRGYREKNVALERLTKESKDIEALIEKTRAEINQLNRQLDQANTKSYTCELSKKRDAILEELRELKPTRIADPDAIDPFREQLDGLVSSIDQLASLRHNLELQKNQESELDESYQLLQHKQDLELLYQDIGKYTEQQRDIPKRHKELTASFGQVCNSTLGKQLKLVQDDPSTISQRLPSDGSIDRLNQLVKDGDEHSAQRKKNEDDLKVAEAALARHEREFKRLKEELIDEAYAKQILRGVESASQQFEQERLAADAKLESLQAEIRTQSLRLNPQVADDEQLKRLAIPPKSSIESSQQRYDEAMLSLDKLMTRKSVLEGNAADLEQQLSEVKQGSQIEASIADLARTRESRGVAIDVLGKAIREPRASHSSENLEQHFESLVREIDAIDQVTDLLLTVPDQIQLERQQQSINSEIAELQQKITRLDEIRNSICRELNAFLPSHDTLLSPNEVQEWLSIRETLLEKKSTYTDLQSKLLDMETQHDADVTDRFNRLCNAGIRLGRAPASAQDLIERLRSMLDQNQGLITKMSVEKNDAQRNRNLVVQLKQERQSLDASSKAWRHEVLQECEDAELVRVHDTSFESDYTLLVRCLRDLGSLRGEISDSDTALRRLTEMHRETEEFEAKVSDLETKSKPCRADVANLSFQDRASRLYEICRTEIKNEERKQHLREEMENSLAQIAEIDINVRYSEGVVSPLFEEACIKYSRDSVRTDVKNLRKEFERAKHIKELEQESHNLLRTLRVQASKAGFQHVDQLIKEVAGSTQAEFDQDVDVLEAATSKRRSTLEANLQEQTRVEIELATLKEGDSLNELILDRNMLVEEASQLTEQYLRAKVPELILRFYVQKFVKEHQDPLIERMSKWFKIFTEGSFERLAVVFESDKSSLVGVRSQSDGATDQLELTVPKKAGKIAELSDGTADQLYLAVRCAVIEDYAQNGTHVPVVLDDVLVHADDQRTKAIIQGFIELSKTTQILLETHHDHVVEIARDQYGEDLNVINL